MRPSYSQRLDSAHQSGPPFLDSKEPASQQREGQLGCNVLVTCSAVEGDDTCVERTQYWFKGFLGQDPGR